MVKLELQSHSWLSITVVDKTTGMIDSLHTPFEWVEHTYGIGEHCSFPSVDAVIIHHTYLSFQNLVPTTHFSLFPLSDTDETTLTMHFPLIEMGPSEKKSVLVTLVLSLSYRTKNLRFCRGMALNSMGFIISAFHSERGKVADVFKHWGGKCDETGYDGITLPPIFFPLTVFLLRSGLSLLVYWAPLSVHFENTYSISSSSFSLSFPLAFSRCIRGNSRAGREGSERPSNGASSDKRPLGYSVFWPVCFSPWMNPVQRSLHSEMRRFFKIPLATRNNRPIIAIILKAA